ncbi:MAG: CPBP family intramembrane glutamic endopeptidase [Anaerolineae bacterium]
MQTRSKPREPLLKRLTRIEPAPPWGGGTVIVMIVSAFLLLIAGSFVALTWLPATPEAKLFGWGLGGIGLIVLVTVRIRNRPDQRMALRLRPNGTPLPFVLFIAVGFALAFDLLSLAVTGGAFLNAPELIGAETAGSLITWVLAVLVMVVIQPISEELVFRGYAFPWLRSAFGAWPGLLLAAVLSAFLHFLIFPPDYSLTQPGLGSLPVLWFGLILPFLAGLVISSTRAITGSTRAAIVAHAGFGLFAVLKLLAMAS